MTKRLAQSPLEKRPLYRDEIKDMLTEMILGGDLKPGDRIVETQLARELGVSQSPIREAIRELEVLGLVINMPFKGTVVRGSTVKEIKDVYVTRASLESTAVRLAVQNADDVDVARLMDILKQMQDAAANDDYHEYVRIDVSFHEHLVGLSGNGILEHLWSQCSIRSITHMGTRRSGSDLVALADRHIGICEALASRDADAAELEVQKHFELLINDYDNIKE